MNPELLETSDALDRAGCGVEASLELLREIGRNRATHAPVEALIARLIAEGLTLPPAGVERVLIGRGASHALPQVPSLKLGEKVRQLLQRDLESLVKQPADPAAYSVSEVAFPRACQLVTFRRFPAGPWEWETDGIPRSWIPTVEAADMADFLATLLAMRGRSPLWFLHTGPKARTRTLLIKSAVEESYRAIIETLELHPEVKGLMLSAWFFHPEAVNENPHLAFMCDPIVEGGGKIVRRRVESDEKCRSNPARNYRLALALWPRAAAIKWSGSKKGTDTNFPPAP